MGILKATLNLTLYLYDIAGHLKNKKGLKLQEMNPIGTAPFSIYSKCFSNMQ